MNGIIDIIYKLADFDGADHACIIEESAQRNVERAGGIAFFGCFMHCRCAGAMRILKRDHSLVDI